MTIEIDISSFRRDDAKLEGTAARPERFWFGWGDWTVVTAIEEDALPTVKRIMDGLAKPWCDAGYIVAGPPDVCLVDGALRMRAQRLESERFAPRFLVYSGHRRIYSTIRSIPPAILIIIDSRIAP